MARYSGKQRECFKALNAYFHKPVQMDMFQVSEQFYLEAGRQRQRAELAVLANGMFRSNTCSTCCYAGDMPSMFFRITWSLMATSGIFIFFFK